jgi:4-nitrophenyl phosphatase
MKLVIFDIDGVLLRGNDPLEHAASTMEWLKKSSIEFVVFTNNSAQLPQTQSRRFANAGVTIEPDKVITSTYTAIDYINEIPNYGKKVLAIGEEGLIEPLKQAGFRIIEFDDPAKADFVVVGFDRQISYGKISRAQHEIIFNNARLIGTNYDLIVPIENGDVRPGGGIMVQAIESSTGVKAVITGKPEPFFIHQLMKKYGASPEEILMVGDNLDTDILAGKKAGIRTVLVLTGIHKQSDILQRNHDNAPDFIIKDLSCLRECIEDN